MNNIILIGFMGCGKTSVGKRLGNKLSLCFKDTDQLIEEKAGKTISEIFADEGEKNFRSMETECLKELIESREAGMVLSVGGGLPLREENRMLLRKLGTVIYLKATGETIYNRVKHDTKRPLLQGNNPRGRILDLMAARKEFYEDAAEFTICVDDKNFTQILEEIEAIL